MNLDVCHSFDFNGSGICAFPDIDPHSHLNLRPREAYPRREATHPRSRDGERLSWRYDESFRYAISFGRLTV